jgi:hypothetical protein
MTRTLLGAAIAALLAAGSAAHAGPIPANTLQYAPPNPTALSTVTTPQMAGAGYANEFTPRYDGVMLVIISGNVNNSGAYKTTLTAEYGTGAAPANAAAGTGSLCGVPTAVTSPATGNTTQFVLPCIITGAVLNNGYWFDVSAASATSATVTLTNLNVVVSEQ